MSDIVIYFIGFLICVLALMTVTSKDIFHSSVWLASVLMCISGVYFYLDAEFLGAVQILVYVGGIVTLFVFAIKLTAKIGDKDIRQNSKQLWPSVILCGVLLFFMMKWLLTAKWATPVNQGASTTIPQLGHSLMFGYLLPFEFISLILLAALVGAIVIGKAKK